MVLFGTSIGTSILLNFLDISVVFFLLIPTEVMVKVHVVDLKTESVAPPISVRAYLNQTVSEFKQLISKVIYHCSQICITQFSFILALKMCSNFKNYNKTLHFYSTVHSVCHKIWLVVAVELVCLLTAAKKSSLLDLSVGLP